jgi:hypothetical protein
MTITDRPYTDEDLRAEAARQYAVLTEDPDFMGVGEQMQDTFIDSTDDNDPDGVEDSGSTWGEALDEDQFDEAQRQIDDLINGAADVSEWAINLGADGLEPSEQQLTFGADEPRVRIHFAFAPDMGDADRRDFVAEIAAATVTAA